MEIRSTIMKDKNLRTHTVSGVLAVDQLLKHLRGIYASPDFQSDMDVLWDLRDADFSAISSADVESVRDLVKDHWGLSGKSKAALIVSGDQDFGMSRMYEILMDQVTENKVMVFRDRKEAYKWIENR